MKHNQSALPIDWAAPNRVGALFSTRCGGFSTSPYSSFNLANQVGDSEAAVAKNRAKLKGQHRFDSICWLDQVHGVNVVEAVNSSVPANIAEADACYTRSSGLACAVMVADCLPVLVTDIEGSCVGVAHAGWRGLCAGVVSNLIDKMAIDPNRALVWLGPCIGPTAFEVGPELLAAFKNSPFFATLDIDSAFKAGQGDRYFADLTTLAKLQLSSLSVSAVYGGQECTYVDAEKYFSYRRDGNTGRMAGLIWINNAPD